MPGKANTDSFSSRSEIRDIIIDADTAIGAPVGLDVDDDLAVLFALASQEVRVIGLTITYGNAPIYRTFADAIRLMKLAGATHIPVKRGAGWLSRDVRKSTDASRFLIDTLLSRKEKTTVLAIGPLTNLAAALSQEPRIENTIDRIVLMGGKLTPGMPEFNMTAHPKATRIVLASSVPKIVVPLETCVQAAFTVEHLEIVKQHSGSVVHEFRGRLNRFIRLGSALSNTVFRGYANRATGGFHPWDVVAAAYLTTPGIFSDERFYVMAMDGRSVKAEPCTDLGDHRNKVTVPATLDAEAFMNLMIQRICSIKRADQSP